MSKRSRSETDADAAASTKRSKKHKRREGASDAPATSDIDQTDLTSSAKEDKAAKKAEKAARKLAKAEKKARKESKSAQRIAYDAAEAAEDDDVEAASNGTGLVPSGSYKQADALSALPQSDIDAFLTKSQITVIDEASKASPLRPITSFEHLPLAKEKLRSVLSGFKAPSPIQAAAWPYLLSGRDAIGVAETGSGKTMAFGLPCVQHVYALSDRGSPAAIRACIVSPTRELALQIHEQMVKLAAPLGLKVACVYGGVNKDEQRATLAGVSIVVATPGRLNDFIQESSLSLARTSFMVLDEADRMLDKGFEPEVRKIVGATKQDGTRQTLMFTATWPPVVRELAASFMQDPVRIMIGDNATGELRANVRITQTVEVMEGHAKNGRLLDVLRQYNGSKADADRILIFCLYKKEAVRVEDFVRSRGFKVAGIHGDLNQQKRTESLEAFKSGKVRLLIATDVAARGLDIPAVKLVVNYTFPLTADDYVHRIGRTGRAGKTGESMTFFTETDKPLAGALINVLKAANQEVPEALLKFGTTVKRKGHDAYGAFYRETDGMKKATKITFD